MRTTTWEKFVSNQEKQAKNHTQIQNKTPEYMPHFAQMPNIPLDMWKNISQQLEVNR